MGRRNEHTREELQTLIIDAATKVILEEGYHALTMRKVAKKIGYAVGSLYMIFPSSDALIMAINGQTLRKLYVVISEDLNALDPSSTPQIVLQQIAMSYVNFSVDSRALWQTVFLHHVSDPALLTSEYYKDIQCLFDLISQHIAVLAPHLSSMACEQWARGLWAAVHGIVWLHLDGKLAIGHFKQPELFTSKVLIKQQVNAVLEWIATVSD